MTYTVKTPKPYGDHVFCFFGGGFSKFYESVTKQDKRNFKRGFTVTLLVKRTCEITVV